MPDDPGKTFILGTEGGLQIQPTLEYITNVGRYQGNVQLKVPSDQDVAFVGHHNYMAHVIRVLRGEEEKVVKREQVLNVMAALEGLYKSGEIGREVRLN